MYPPRCFGTPLKGAILSFFLLLTLICSINAQAEYEKVVGKEVVDGSDTSANSDTPLPDLFTGTMSYRIPIDVPPGRRGVDPGIVLTYRSTNGNGWLGVGWELEMGAIERTTRGGVNYGVNGFVMRGPGGTTELVEVSGAGASPQEYRAKIEGVSPGISTTVPTGKRSTGKGCISFSTCLAAAPFTTRIGVREFSSGASTRSSIRMAITCN